MNPNMHIAEMFGDINGATDDVHSEQYCQNGTIIGQCHTRALVFCALQVLENIFPWHHEAKHIASGSSSATRSLHTFVHQMAVRLLELVRNQRGPAK